MGAMEIQGGGPGMQERRLTCAHCPVGLVALPLTWLVVKVFIISGAGVKAKAAVWPRGPPFSTRPCSLPAIGYGMSKGCPATRCCSTRSLLGLPRPPQSSSAWHPSASWASLPMSATAGTDQTQSEGLLCAWCYDKGLLG